MEDLSKVIVFMLKDQQYGVNLQQVLSIERLQAITHVPQTSSFIKGVMNLRGDIIPIIDLMERLSVGSMVQDDSTRVLIVEIDTYKIGLVVDTATDVIDLESSMIEPAPSIIGGVKSEYIKGVAKLEGGLLVLLDLEHVLNVEEQREVLDVVNEEKVSGGH
ncbi:chemotaxis protein CheW [Bacillus dakarensis]|uniref:chemotaxis protein CheW n=1 Tax=Robertmurraya dakarensis TaxID=1926278 RepID=UPI00098230A0|nr:chemotaxis protein CheW [Bacillus dakarensis]